jgi:hypothetical protein
MLEGVIVRSSQVGSPVSRMEAGGGIVMIGGAHALDCRLGVPDWL